MGIDGERKYSKHERFNVMQEIEKNTERIYQQVPGGRGEGGFRPGGVVVVFLQ